MGSSSSKPKKDIEEMASRPIFPNPLLADLQKKEQEVAELKRTQQERALEDEHAKQSALKQHRHDLSTLHSLLDHEIQGRRAAEYSAHADRLAKQQAETLREKAEQEARDAEHRAKQAMLEREKAVKDAQESQKAREEAEARANAHLELQKEKARIAADEAEAARIARDRAEKQAVDAQRARHEAEQKAHTELQREKARLAREQADREEKEAQRRKEAADKANADLEIQREKALRAADEAESARLARETAEQRAIEAQLAKKAAEEKAEMDRLEREKAEKEREEAVKTAQESQKAREEAEERANAHLEIQREKARIAAEEAESARISRERAEKQAAEAQRARHEAEQKAHTELEREKARLAREQADREVQEAQRRKEAADKANAELELQREKAFRAAEEAQSARLAREAAEQQTLQAQQAKQAAEEKAGLDRLEREKAEKAREEACVLVEQHEAKERAAREAAERERLEWENAERDLRLQISNASNAINAAEAAKAEAERKLGALMYSQAQVANQQPVKQPTPEDIERVKRERQYTEGLLHFAIAGVAGSGKSSLINAFRGISKGSTDAADTGVVETTMTIGRYPDPKNTRFVWYDIPGAGTASIASAHYFTSQGLFIFDCIIVLIDSRVQETDLAILKNCEQYNIPAFIVRSKSDEHIKAIADEMREQLEEESEDESAAEDKLALKKREARYASIEAEAKAKYIRETRENIETNLRKAGLKSQKCYLISRRVLLKMVQGRKLGPTATAKMIDEQELVTDALASVKERRFSAPTPRPPQPKRKWSSWVGLS